MTILTFASLLGIGYMAACAVRYLPRPMLIKISLYVAALYATQHHVGPEATMVAVFLLPVMFCLFESLVDWLHMPAPMADHPVASDRASERSDSNPVKRQETEPRTPEQENILDGEWMPGFQHRPLPIVQPRLARVRCIGQD